MKIKIVTWYRPGMYLFGITTAPNITGFIREDGSLIISNNGTTTTVHLFFMNIDFIVTKKIDRKK